MSKIISLVLRTAGINCDKETVEALKLAGSNKVDLLHINKLKKQKKMFTKYDLIVFPGGFSYGDTVSAGKILANEMKFIFKEEIEKFLQRGKFIIGICNGFQVLLKSGIFSSKKKFEQTYSLIENDNRRFECRWVYLRVNRNVFWTKNLPEVISLPIAHGEGKFVTTENELKRLQQEDQIVFQYCDKNGNIVKDYPINPNGSLLNIAGITNSTGQILGMMPHPERFHKFFQHPFWTLLRYNEEFFLPFGLQIFKNAIEELKKRK